MEREGVGDGDFDVLVVVEVEELHASSLRHLGQSHHLEGALGAGALPGALGNCDVGDSQVLEPDDDALYDAGIGGDAGVGHHGLDVIGLEDDAVCGRDDPGGVDEVERLADHGEGVCAMGDGDGGVG